MYLVEGLFQPNLLFFWLIYVYVIFYNEFQYIFTLFFYKQLENKQLGPVFAKKLSNFLSNCRPDFQPKILSNFC